MKKFFVDFQGYCSFEAETAEEAEAMFWNCVMEGIALPHNVYEVEGVEEDKE